MALVTLTLKTDADGGSGTWYGDAFARTHATLDWPWNQSDASDFLGTDAKVGNPENVMFLRYDAAAVVPAGAAVLHAKIEISALAIVHTGGFGAFRVGVLQDDGKWDVNALGWQEGLAADQYEFSYELPFPTGPGSDTINIGVLFLNAFAGTVIYVNGADDNRVWSFGDVDAMPDHNLTTGNPLSLLLGVSIATQAKIGIVLDPSSVPAVAESITIETDDAAPKGKRGPRLILTYDENPPTITSGNPTTTAVQSELWNDHTVTATDPTSQAITFTLDEAPSGMTIDATTGLITWTGTAAYSPGSYTIDVRATDTDGFFDTQQITVGLEPAGDSVDPSETTIANGALVGILGERRISSLEEDTKAASLAKERFAEVRDELLRLLPWHFATKRASLAVDPDPPVYRFTRRFRLPSDLIRILTVDDQFGYGYTVEQGFVLTDIQAPLLITYTRRETDPRQMDPLFRSTLSASLALDLAEAITGSSDKLRQAVDAFQRRFATAAVANGQENPPPDVVASEMEHSRGKEEL